MKFKFEGLEKQVLDSLSKKGRIYLVGGIVRDYLLYHQVDYHDVDVEIYDLEIEEIDAILSKYGHVNRIGKSFGILKLDTLPHFDFAMPRKESKSGKTHREFDVTVCKNLDLKEACRRRDFTINAFMYDYKNDQILDFYNGKVDLQKGILKMIDEKTFQEDPLRILRLAQFMARFEMKADKKTKEVCQRMVQKGELDYLSKERVLQEYNKLLLSIHPSIGLKFLLEIGAIIEPLETLVTCPQRLDFHPEGNVMNHTLLVVDLAALCRQKTSWPLAFMWSALLHDIGKPLVTTPEGKAPGHNESGVQVFNQYFNHFFENKKIKKYIKTMIYYHMHLMNMVRDGAKDYSYLRILKGIDGIVKIEDLILITKCDKLGRYKDEHESINHFDSIMKEKMFKLGTSCKKAIVGGNDLKKLGIKQTSRYKELLEYAYDLQLRGHDKASILKMIKGR